MISWGVGMMSMQDYENSYKISKDEFEKMNTVPTLNEFYIDT